MPHSVLLCSVDFVSVCDAASTWCQVCPRSGVLRYTSASRYRGSCIACSMFRLLRSTYSPGWHITTGVVTYCDFFGPLLSQLIHCVAVLCKIHTAHTVALNWGQAFTFYLNWWLETALCLCVCFWLLVRCKGETISQSANWFFNRKIFGKYKTLIVLDILNKKMNTILTVVQTKQDFTLKLTETLMHGTVFWSIF